MGTPIVSETPPDQGLFQKPVLRNRAPKFRRCKNGHFSRFGSLSKWVKVELSEEPRASSLALQACMLQHYAWALRPARLLALSCFVEHLRKYRICSAATGKHKWKVASARKLAIPISRALLVPAALIGYRRGG